AGDRVGILFQNFAAPFIATDDVSSLRLIALRRVGPPQMTTVGVSIDESGVPSFATTMIVADPAPDAPQIESLKLDFVELAPVVRLTGKRFKTADAGQREETFVEFTAGTQAPIRGTVVSFTGDTGPDDPQVLVVAVPQSTAVGQARITV